MVHLTKFYACEFNHAFLVEITIKLISVNRGIHQEIAQLLDGSAFDIVPNSKQRFLIKLCREYEASFG